MNRTEIIDRLGSIILSAGVVCDWMAEKPGLLNNVELTHQDAEGCARQVYLEAHTLLGALSAEQDKLALLPFRDSPRCPKCKGDKKMKPLFRTYHTIVQSTPRRWCWDKLKFLRVEGEHLHMTCASCQFTFDMECAPQKPLHHAADCPVAVDWNIKP